MDIELWLGFISFNKHFDFNFRILGFNHKIGSSIWWLLSVHKGLSPCYHGRDSAWYEFAIELFGKVVFFRKWEQARKVIE